MATSRCEVVQEYRHGARRWKEALVGCDRQGVGDGSTVLSCALDEGIDSIQYRSDGGRQLV
jgi:hypothetical protein